MSYRENGARLPIVESLIMSSPEPLPARKIAEVIDDLSPKEIDEIIDELNIKYTKNDLSFRIRRIAGGYQLYIIENYARYVEDMFTRRRNVRLTRAALETMAIIAYRQPVTRTDIEMIRGVASDSVIHTLLERKLITLAGRAATIGRPLLYKTTDEFLKFFNLDNIDDLPRMEEIEELMAANEPSPPQQSLPLSQDDKESSAVDNDEINIEDDRIIIPPPVQIGQDSNSEQVNADLMKIPQNNTPKSDETEENDTAGSERSEIGDMEKVHELESQKKN